MVTPLASEMASLLGDKVFEITGQAPSPSKDFFQLVITKTEVIWTWWKISIRIGARGVRPGQKKESHQDYLHDSQLQYRVSEVFGQQILQYTKALCQGHFDYLERLPNHLLLRVLAYLDLEDVGRLAQTTQRLRKLCNSPEFWEQTVKSRCHDFTTDMEALINAMGWRKFFFTFIHNKGGQ